MFNGIYEVHLKVSDLSRTMHFYSEILGLEIGLRDPHRPIAFYRVGKRNEGMLGIWEVAAGEEVKPQHFAFTSTLEDVLNAPQWLAERGLSGCNFLNDGSQTPLVHAWMPAISYYFRDPDGHSLELIATLNGQPKPELGIVTLEEWQSE